MEEGRICETDIVFRRISLFRMSIMKISIREPGSAITHFIALILSFFAALPLIAKAGLTGNTKTVSAVMIFICSMILLYGASTLYHSVTVRKKVLRIFQKADHMMIFILIAGSYTPVCLITLGGKTGHMLFVTVRTIAAIGILIKAFWIDCPKWFSSILYIAMGWICVFVFGRLLESIPAGGFFWLLLGGIFYTVGGVIYALKLPLFNAKHVNFGTHEIFHLFVMAGSICHYIFVYQYIA